MKATIVLARNSRRGVGADFRVDGVADLDPGAGTDDSCIGASGGQPAEVVLRNVPEIAIGTGEVGSV